MKNKQQKIVHIAKILLLILPLALGASLVFAADNYIYPTTNGTSGGTALTPGVCSDGNPACYPPINVSNAEQTKTGNLNLGGVQSAGLKGIAKLFVSNPTGVSSYLTGLIGIYSLSSGTGATAVTGSATGLNSYGGIFVAPFNGLFARGDKAGIYATNAQGAWGIPLTGTGSEIRTDGKSYAGYFTDGIRNTNSYAGYFKGRVAINDGTAQAGYVLTADDSTGTASWKASTGTNSSSAFWGGSLSGNIYKLNRGYVGIGTSAPTYPLTVSGVGMFGNANSKEVLLGMSANTAGHEGVSLYHDGNESFLTSVDSGTAWQDLSLQASNVRFDINGGTDKVVISSTGLGVNGKIAINDGTQGAGKVLTSDANGNASWATPASGGTSVAGKSCASGQVMTGFDASGNLICTALPKTKRFVQGVWGPPSPYCNAETTINTGLTKVEFAFAAIGTDSWTGDWAIQNVSEPTWSGSNITLKKTYTNKCGAVNIRWFAFGE